LTNEFSTVPLDSVLDFKEGPGILAKDFRSHGVPLIRLAGVKRGANILTGCNFLDPEMVKKKWSHFALEVGDVLLSTSASLGEVAIVGDDGVGAIPYTGLIRFRPKTELVSQRFIPVALSSASFKRQIEAMGSGSVLRHFGPMHLRKMTLDLPPLHVQERIADVVGAIDSKIESNRRAVEISLKLLDALAADTALTLRSTRLADLVVVTKESVNPATLGNQLVDHFSLPAFDNGCRPERVSADTIMSSKQKLPGRAILLSRLNPRIDRTWWATAVDGTPGLASTEFLCLTARGDADLAAVWLAIRSEEFLSELPARVTGTSGSHQRVRPEDVLAIEVRDTSRLPESIKQTALGLLESTEQRLEEITRLTTLRDVLLPELLSGRVRVPEASQAVFG
jgi:type I restriction enzyme S subunit